MSKDAARDPRLREVVQVNLRMNKRLVKVLKAAAATLDLTFSDLVEGITASALQGVVYFEPDELDQLDKLQSVYGLDEFFEEIMKIQGVGKQTDSTPSEDDEDE